MRGDYSTSGPKLPSTVAQKSVKVGTFQQKGVLSDKLLALPILDFRFLFLVENFIPFEGEYLHGIESYCEVKLGIDDVVAQIEGYEFHWLAVDDLSDVDLRPIIVRDRIIDGTYNEVRHLISRD